MSSGCWMAQLVKHSTLDFSSGHDLRVMGLSPTSDFALGMEPALDSFFPSPSVSLKKFKFFFKIHNFTSISKNSEKKIKINNFFVHN